MNNQIMQMTHMIAQAPGLDDVVGAISPPPGVKQQIDQAVAKQAINPGENALIFFVSNILRVGAIVMGLWVVFNVLLAGYDFITNKDSSAAQTKVRDKLTMSAIGLFLIVAAYTIAGVISLILFGDAGYILNPEF